MIKLTLYIYICIYYILHIKGACMGLTACAYLHVVEQELRRVLLFPIYLSILMSQQDRTNSNAFVSSFMKKKHVGTFQKDRILRWRWILSNHLTFPPRSSSIWREGNNVYVPQTTNYNSFSLFPLSSLSLSPSISLCISLSLSSYCLHLNERKKETHLNLIGFIQSFP